MYLHIIVEESSFFLVRFPQNTLHLEKPYLDYSNPNVDIQKVKNYWKCEFLM